MVCANQRFDCRGSLSRGSVRRVEERIVLIGGPCSGQIHDVQAGTSSVKALDDTGDRHVYVRTNASDLSEDVAVIIFRLAEDPT